MTFDILTTLAGHGLVLEASARYANPTVEVIRYIVSAIQQDFLGID